MTLRPIIGVERIDMDSGDPAGAALWRVLNLAEKWENATELTNGQPSIVARAFAAELRAAIEGDQT